MTQRRLHRLQRRIAAVPDKHVRTELLRFIDEASRQIARQDEEDAAFERWCEAEQARYAAEQNQSGESHAS